MSTQAYSSLRSLPGWAFAVLLALATSTTGATVLHQQLPFDGGNGSYANLNTPQQGADDFALGGSVNLESVSWWGAYDGNFDAGDDDFLVRLYSSVAGTGTVLQEFGSAPFVRSDAGMVDVAGNTLYRYDFDVTDFTLAAGTYYFFVQNLGSSDWIWQEGVSGSDEFWSRLEDADIWALAEDASGQPVQWDLAFEINGTRIQQVPEPSSLGLLGIAGLSMILARRWRKRHVG
jgi:hypothetical protein